MAITHDAYMLHVFIQTLQSLSKFQLHSIHSCRDTLRVHEIEEKLHHPPKRYLVPASEKGWQSSTKYSLWESKGAPPPRKELLTTIVPEMAIVGALFLGLGWHWGFHLRLPWSMVECVLFFKWLVVLPEKIRLLQVPGRLWRHLVIVKDGLERMMWMGFWTNCDWRSYEFSFY